MDQNLGPGSGDSSRSRDRESAESLVDSEDRLRSILENSTDWIWEMGLDGRHTYSNHRVEVILGYTQKEFVEIDFMGLLHPDDRAEVEARLPGLIAEKRGWNGWVIRARRKDGTYRSLESNASPVFDRSGNLIGFQGVDRDVTDREATEEWKHRSQKLDAIGQLAGGIAHDFNNLLTVILGNASILEDHPLLASADPALRSLLAQISSAGERGARLTGQLLSFSRKGLAQNQVFDVNESLGEMKEMLRRLLGEHIQLDFQLHPGALHVEADPGRIEQVYLNLAINARDAMKDGGRLRFQTERRVLERPGDHSLRVEPGEYVMLTVEDSGHGMSGQTMEHIFEPFFTTKPTGKGSGLGLSTVYGIVTEAGGDVTVESRVGEGSTLRVFLPFTEKKPSERGPVHRPGGSETACERILVCEDEPGVRSVMCRILEADGYEVSEAATPSSALSQAEGNGPFDLLITDVVMPEMNGVELARELRVRRPDLRVLLVSGHPRELIEQQGLVEGEMTLLHKPFQQEALSQSVRQILSSQG